MKLHHWAAIGVIVVLIAIGFGLNAWVLSTFDNEEETHASETDPGGTTGGDNAGSAGTSGGAGDSTGTPSGGTGTGSSSGTVPGGGIAIDAEVVELGGEQVVLIYIKAVGEPLNLSGWRLTNALGAAGHADYIFYFKQTQIAPDQTLTIYSSCGLDSAETLYWCLNQPDLLLSPENPSELFLFDAQQRSALTCTPAVAENQSVHFECN